MNYYNEWDKKTAAWLRELIKAGLIPKGEVDERSITDVQPRDLRGFTQCHFFAGIGGWSYALQLAGWPEFEPVWTASLPCQPFSSAGEQKGASDDRHLWPVFHRLVRVIKPQRIFGEQVAKAIGFNWLDGISADLESQGYCVGASVLGAHSVGAPQIRNRLFWMADSERYRGCQPIGNTKRKLQTGNDIDGRGYFDGLANAACYYNRRQPRGAGKAQQETRIWSGRNLNHGCSIGAWSEFKTVECCGKLRRIKPGLEPLVNGIPNRVAIQRGYGNAIVPQVAAEFIGAYLDTLEDFTRNNETV